MAADIVGLQTVWGTLNPGTTVQKLTQLNAMTVATPLKAFPTMSQVINACVAADVSALTAVQLSMLNLIVANQVDCSPGTTGRSVIQTIFSGKATTLANLSALMATFDNATVPWWQAHGFGGPIIQNDLIAAGGLT